MTTALRRRLSALREMAAERGHTPGGGAAARAAEARILLRLRDTLEELVTP